MTSQGKNEAAQQDKRYIFEKMPVPKALAHFMVPTVLSQMAALLLNLADAFFIGRTGDAYQVSAMTLTFPIYLCMTVIPIMFGAGGNASIAASLGIGDRKRARRYAVFSLYTALFMALLYGVLTTGFGTPLLTALGASEYSLGYCKDYMFWAILLGSVPLTFNQVISQLFLAEGEGKTAGFGITLSSILNVVLDPVFIFVFDMGIGGAALATCLSSWVGAVYYLYQWYKRRHTTVVSLDIRLYRPGGHIAARTLSIGVPAGLVPLLTNVCDLVRNYFLAALGSDIEVAGWGSVQKVIFALYTISMGIAQGARPVISYNYARGDLRRTRSLANGTMVIMALYLAAGIALINLIPELIIKLFVTNAESVEWAMYFLRISLYSIIGVAFIDLFNAVFQAVGRWKLSLANTILNKGCLLTPVLILLANLYGIRAIPYSQVITECATAVVLFFVYLYVTRKFNTSPQQGA